MGLPSTQTWIKQSDLFYETTESQNSNAVFFYVEPVLSLPNLVGPGQNG